MLKWFKYLGSVFLVGLVVACAVNPATGRRQLALISENQEIQMGMESDQALVAQMGMYDDPGVQGLVESMGRRMAAASERPDLPWSFRVMDDPVVNAFALPGGFVYITRGIMAYLNSEAELAEIVGHEIGHVTARHSVEQLSRAQLTQVGLVAGVVLAPDLADFAGAAQAGAGLLFLKFGRDDERESDDLGLRYMIRVGYDPRAAPDVFDMLDRVSQGGGAGRTPEWLSTHPNPANRAQRLRDAIAAMPNDFTGRTVGVESYLDAIDGMVYGTNPRHGFFRDNLFLHPDLDFQLTFPSGWATSNQQSAVLAISPEENVMIQLSLASDSATVLGLARRFMAQDGVTGLATETSINGHPAAGGSFDATSGQAQLRGEIYFVRYGSNVYQLLSYGTTAGWGQHGSVARSTLRSFDRVADRDVLNVQPQRLDVVVIDRPMTLAQFSARYPSIVSLDELAVLNRRDPDVQMPSGTRIKRVVE